MKMRERLRFMHFLAIIGLGTLSAAMGVASRESAELLNSESAELFNKPNAEWNRIRGGQDGGVVIYGRDGFITVDRDQTLIEHWQESTQKSRSLCNRSAILASSLCRNFIQFVEQLANNRTLFCGTDAAFQTCYILKDGVAISQFSGNHLVGLEPAHSTLMEIVNREMNELSVISAAPNGDSNENEFGVYLSRISLNGNTSDNKQLRRTAEATFRSQTHFLTSIHHDHHFILFGRDEANTGFAYHVCDNDPGLFSDSSQWLSGARAPLTCCKANNFCYPNLLDARLTTNNGGDTFLFGLFKADFGSMTAVCVFSKQDLVDHFKHSPYKTPGGSPSYGVQNDRGHYRTPNDCRGYEPELHETISQYVTSYRPLTTGRLAGTWLNLDLPAKTFPTRMFDVARVNDAFLLLLFGDGGRVQKNTIIHKNNTFVINHNLEFSFAQKNNLTDVKIMGGELIAIHNKRMIERVSVSRCAEYVTCAACIAIGDILCGWNRAHRACQAVDGRKTGLIQEVETPAAAINQYCNRTADLAVKFTRKATEPITIAAQTSRVPVFDGLTWRRPDGTKLDENNLQFVHSYQPEFKRAQLVVYPDTAQPAQFDGMYSLEYKIRGVVIHTSAFSIVPFKNQTIVITPVPDLEEEAPAITDGPGPNQAGGNLIVMCVIVALCAIVIALFVIILVRCNRHKRTRKDANRIDLDSVQYKRAQLRGQPSGESIHESANYEIDNRKNDLCDVTYDSAFESRQSPHQQMCAQINTRDADGQSESRSEKDNSDVFISCPSQQGSLSSIDQSLSEQAIVLFPDGTLKRIKTKTMERLKDEMRDVTSDPESERILQGTLRKTLKKK